MNDSQDNRINAVQYDKHGFLLHGKRVFIYGGELHYFRIPPSQWYDRLNKCKQAFFNSIGAYFAWNWHEREEGKFDFTEERDVRKWLFLIKDFGMYCIARPGPYICSEWNFGGFPNWVALKDAEFRSADERFLTLCRNWFREIDALIIPFLITRGGNIYLYQIENEFWWNNLPYHEKLERIVREDGIDVPMVTNTNGLLPLYGSQVLDSITSYPIPWNVDDTARHLNRLFRLQPNMPKMLMELEGGWFTSFGGAFPTNRGYFPPEWTDVYVKTLIAQGVNAMNYYMFHGGTNPGYWTGRGVTTSYDWDGAIREWGELSERYYVIRRIGAFLARFGAQVAEAEPHCQMIQTHQPMIEVLALASEKNAFLFPRNLFSSEADFKVVFLHPETHQPVTIPKNGEYHLSGYSMAILPINIELSEGIVLHYTTSQVLTSYEQNDTVYIVLYERPGFDGEIAFEVKGYKGAMGSTVQQHSPFIVEESYQENCLTLNYRHNDKDAFVIITAEKTVKLVITSTKRAGRTWLPTFRGNPFPVLSDVYFLESSSEEGGRLTLTFQTKPEDGEEINILSAEKPREVRLNNKRVDFNYDEQHGVITVHREAFSEPSLFWDISSGWRFQAEHLESETKHWSHYRPPKSLEAHGLLQNGYHRFRTSFNLPKASELPEELFLIFCGFHDELTAYVNGQFVGTGVEQLECSICSAIKPGQNIVDVYLECIGHQHSGFKSFNGITSPVGLTRRQHEITMNSWRRRYLPCYLSELEFCAIPNEARVEYDDTSWESVTLAKNLDNRFRGSGGDRMTCWYRTNVTLDNSLQGKHFVFDMGKTDDAFLFVNSRFIGTSYRDSRRAYDVTDVLEFGRENVIAVGVRGRDLLDGLGLLYPIRMRMFDALLDGEWKVQPGLLGEEKGWHQREYDDSAWMEVVDPNQVQIPSSAPVLWWRKQVHLALPEGYVAPLRLTLDGAHSRALIYFNGVLMGRYSDEGPQRDFYIFEDILRLENTVAIAVEGRDKPPQLGRVSISAYYVAKREKLEIVWT